MRNSSEHEYERKGALNLFAAFDTRTGKVWGQSLGVHYPSDILAGWMALIAWAIGVSWIVKPWRRGKARS